MIASQLNLLARPGVGLDEIERVVSYPDRAGPVPQLPGPRAAPGVETIAANSTADAPAPSPRTTTPHTAAIGPPAAADVYGLEVLAPRHRGPPREPDPFRGRSPVGDPGAHRPRQDLDRRVPARRRARLAARASSRSSRPARINLTKLESRPTKKGLGDYCFIIDLEGHIADEVVADCLRELTQKQAEVKFLGSYPAAGARALEDSDKGLSVIFYMAQSFDGYRKFNDRPQGEFPVDSSYQDIDNADIRVKLKTAQSFLHNMAKRW